MSTQSSMLAERVEHARESGDDLGELGQHSAAAQRPGVVHDRLEAQHVFALPALALDATGTGVPRLGLCGVVVGHAHSSCLPPIAAGFCCERVAGSRDAAAVAQWSR